MEAEIERQRGKSIVVRGGEVKKQGLPVESWALGVSRGVKSILISQRPSAVSTVRKVQWLGFSKQTVIRVRMGTNQKVGGHTSGLSEGRLSTRRTEPEEERPPG